MTFTGKNLSVASDLNAFELHLSSNTYASGFDLSQLDVVLFHSLKCAKPCFTTNPNVARWYGMVSSYACFTQMLLTGATCGNVCTKKAAVKPSENDDDVDLFGDEEPKVDMKEQMKKAVASKKKVAVNKSSVQFELMAAGVDVDVSALYDTRIKTIELEGLSWGPTAKELAGPFGLKKLVFGCAIVDSLISVDDIEDRIETIGMSEADTAKYLQLKKDGDLEDEEIEWAGKVVGSVSVTSFQKI